ncbi:DUF2975 domain-containing protein [uncultured Polaribacter sp.]|uniref:DUF2975 domain-containing protein n=1 Tax=uncultured Polaribacter sp. TaxID=174711 RepID=UPI0026137349|nr:DUF2975 domain-containing protein [uncultured Polaribacter sp.]
MRKLNILKAIVDFMWIIAVPITAPLILLLIIAIWFDKFSGIDFNFLGIEVKLDRLPSKIIIFLTGTSFLLQIYCLHIFKKVLRYFKNVKIFDVFVINSFHTIGKLLTISGALFLCIGFVGKIYLQNKISISLGLHPYLLIIGLGLFFQILSEVFKIAKNTKQENDLTI